MTIEQQIAIHCDDDTRSPCEILAELINNGQVYVGGEYLELFEITDKISEEDRCDAGHANLRGNSGAIYDLYLKTLEEYLA